VRTVDESEKYVGKRRVYKNIEESFLFFFLLLGKKCENIAHLLSSAAV